MSGEMGEIFVCFVYFVVDKNASRRVYNRRRI